MLFGSISLAHQQVYVDGRSSFGKLQPGHLHCLGGGISPDWFGARCCVDPSFFDHFFMHDM